MIVSSNACGAGPTAPREFAQQQLESRITSGSISQGDEEALGGALDAIDNGISAAFLQSDSPPAGAADVAAKIDEIITHQLNTGKLTGDQADELRRLVSGDNPDDPGDSVNPLGAAVPGDAPHDGGQGSLDPTQRISEFLKQVQANSIPSRYSPQAVFGQPMALESLLFDTLA